MATVSLSQLATQAREAADMVASDFVSDTEVYGLLKAYSLELFDMLVASYGHEYFASSYTFQTVPGQESYDIFDKSSEKCGDFYKLLGVDLDTCDGCKQSLEPYSFASRNAYTARHGWRCALPVRYRIHGENMTFSPAPDGAYSITVHYIPDISIAAESGTFLDILMGWERYVVVSAAIAMLNKEQSDTSVLQAEKALLIRRIEGMSKNRDAGAPQQVGSRRRSRGAY